MILEPRDKPCSQCGHIPTFCAITFLRAAEMSFGEFWRCNACGAAWTESLESEEKTEEDIK